MCCLRLPAAVGEGFVDVGDAGLLARYVANRYQKLLLNLNDTRFNPTPNKKYSP